jgi:plastocyanin
MSPKGWNPWFAAILLVALAATSSCKSGYSSPNPTSPGTVRELDSGDLGNGASYEHRFAVAGTYAYHCIHHAPMTGSVQVNASATDTLVNVDIPSSTMSFPAASVKPGGRVVWRNSTAVLHTVTSN